MKKIFTLFAFVLLSSNVFAQAPQKMSYQAVIRNSSNDLVASTSIGMKISIVQGSDSGTVVFSETQSITTNNNGLATLEIGNGSVLEGTFGDIDWSQGPYFIKTETDPTGGTNYSITGTSELMSVPYALFALNSTPGPQGEPGEPGLTGATGSVANVGTISEASTANGATVTAGELKLAPADENNPGVVTTEDQTFSGDKSFRSDITVNGIKVGIGGTDSTAYENVAVGINSLSVNTSGARNSAYGESSLSSNTKGLENTAYGAYSLQNNTLGNENNALGKSALANNSEGNSNTAIGIFTLYFNTLGSFNTAIGSVAGSENTGSYNTFLGNNSNSNGLISNATAIGYGATVSSDNTIQLGNTSVTDVNTSGTITANGFKTQLGTSIQYLMADGSISTGAVTSIGTISEASTANGATVTAGELKLAPADATNGGIVTSGSQTFAGKKIFSGGLKVENKPFLPTKLNQSQINSLSALEEGMLVYNTDTRKLQLYSVGASDAINDSFTGTFTSDFLLGMEQTFIPPTTGIITAIQLFVKSDMDPELSLDIDFRDDSGTGLGFASDYIPFANPGSAEWINLSVSNINVTAGQTYKFSINNMMRAMYGTNSNYFNGSLIAGCCGPANGDDLMFKILITPTNGNTAYWLNLN